MRAALEKIIERVGEVEVNCACQNFCAAHGGCQTCKRIEDSYSVQPSFSVVNEGVSAARETQRPNERQRVSFAFQAARLS